MAWNRLENNVKGTLTTGIDAVATSMTVSLLAGSKSYPASIDADNPIYLTLSSPSNPLSNEIVKVTAVSGSNVTTMIRAQRDTTARAWVAGTIVSINLHAEDIEEMRAYVKADGTYYAATGSATTPSLIFSSDTDTGFYWKAANQIGFAASGSAVGYFASTGWNGAVVGNVTGNLSGNVTGNVTGNLSGNVVLSAGTEALPSLAITGDLNTGFWSSAADTLDWSTGGTKRLTLSTTALTSTLPVVIPIGSAAAPSLTFAGYTNYGLYCTGTNLSIAQNGSQRAFFDVNGMSLNGRITIGGVSGTAAAPSIDLSAASGYGIYYTLSGNKLGLTLGGTGCAEWAAGTFTRAYSGGGYADTLTNYYEGTARNTLTVRATRGTSASPDYLDADDVVGKLKFEAMDGSGTWGDVAEIRVSACDDHASGDTPGCLAIYATKDGSDTQTKVAGFESYIYGPGVVDLELPRIDTRMVTFWDYGSNVGFGYFEDVFSDLGITIPDGVSVFDTSNATPLRIHIGTDDYIYTASDTGTIGENDCYRFGHDGSGALSFEQRQSGSYAVLFGHDGTDFSVATGDINVTSGDLNLADGDIVLSADDTIYIGAKDTDGTWSISRSGDDLIFQRRESGTYVTKQTIED